MTRRSEHQTAVTCQASSCVKPHSAAFFSAVRFSVALRFYYGFLSPRPDPVCDHCPM